MSQQMPHLENPCLAFLSRPLKHYVPYYKKETQILDFSLYCNIEHMSFIYRSPKAKASFHFTSKRKMRNTMVPFLAKHIYQELDFAERCTIANHILTKECYIDRNRLRNFISECDQHNLNTEHKVEIFLLDKYFNI